MRNVDDNPAAEGPQSDGGGGYSPVAARGSRRRRHLMIGAAGLIAVLGAGAVVTHQVRDDTDTASAVAEPEVLAPIASNPPVAERAPAVDRSAVRPSTAGSSPPVAPSQVAPSQPAAPTPAPVTSTPRTVQERIKAAREAAAKGGAPVQRPLPEPAAAAATAAADVTEVNVPTAGGMLKVVSARGDLTGVRELAWVADKGVPVGRARCTSKIRLSPDAPAKTRPTLLLCWNTSATKSAYTIAADPAGPPSKKESVAAIDKALAKLS
jgi:hypothetical protein